MGAGIVRLVTDASFEKDVVVPGRLILVAFGASWCGPCQLMAPALRALAVKHRDRLMIAKLDVDYNPETVDRFGIETVPMGLLFRDGEEIARLDGYMPLRKLEAELAPYLATAES